MLQTLVKSALLTLPDVGVVAFVRIPDSAEPVDDAHLVMRGDMAVAPGVHHVD